MEITRSGSQPSGKGPAEYFTGAVRIDPLFQAPDPARVSGASVTFEPGARTAWHTHPLGQTLIVTAGLGWVQREGGPVEEIRPGDVVWFPPGEKHWHGATPTTAMTHIAIQESARRQGRRLDGAGQRRAVPQVNRFGRGRSERGRALAGRRRLATMNSQRSFLGHRVALGGIVASALMTQLAFGQTAQDPAPSQGEASMKIGIEFNGAKMTATLDDNPSTRDFASMLPLDLTIDDYSTNEKIAYLPRKLTEEGSGPFGDEAPGDLAYYAPWGNLAFFHGSYRYSSGLIRLARIDGDIAPLLVRGKFDLRIELIS